MHYSSILFRITLFIGVITLIVACNKSPIAKAITDYDQLCQIYEDIAGKPISPAMRGYEISERIEKEIPSISEDYGHIVSSDPGKTYSLFRKSAKLATKQEWDCPVMEAYFSGEFDQR